MFVLARAVTYSVLFIGLLLVYLPGQLLSTAGINRPAVMGLPQIAGMMIGTVGGLIALFVRNPMYLGAALALIGAALFYESLSILIYAAVFLFITHLFVVLYEEPTLRQTFGTEYEDYCRRVRRWRIRAGRTPSSAL
jgi:protein-S-isoprenylcysteine O-methyltransferase Ste14